MPRPNVPSRSRAWPRVAILTLVGLLAAGCSDSARFDSSPYASNRRQPADVTGSIAARPAPASRVAAQPLPAASRPATVAATGGYADGAQGLGAYRPGERSADITGSVPERRAPVPPPVPAGHWTWDGGAPVTVGRGQSLKAIARKYGVPVSAIMQVNRIANPSAIRPGQRLVIPRYVSGSAPRVATVAPAPQARAGEDIHIVAPGETLISIARHHRISLSALAHANNINSYAKLKIGERLAIPAGGRRLSENRTPAPRPAQPRTVAVQSVGSVPTQNVRMAKAETHEHESVTKTAEPAGAMPTFRWPVHGRIIAAFGSQPNGTQNDGINLAVPAGTPIKAADDGVVAYAGNELKGYGNLVLVRHSNGFVSAYANASQLLVKRGESVKRGQVIARAGQTGNVTFPQLHFEIRKGSIPVDPTKYLNGA
jgi:murein DD-endopeptidase MepM/ murein hydrolase activator NlpD